MASPDGEKYTGNGSMVFDRSTVHPYEGKIKDDDESVVTGQEKEERSMPKLCRKVLSFLFSLFFLPVLIKQLLNHLQNFL
jgi:Ca2+/Na+ antiporter